MVKIDIFTNSNLNLWVLSITILPHKERNTLASGESFMRPHENIHLIIKLFSYIIRLQEICYFIVNPFGIFYAIWLGFANRN